MKAGIGKWVRVEAEELWCWKFVGKVMGDSDTVKGDGTWLGGVIPFGEFIRSCRSQAQAVWENRFPFDRCLKASPSLHPCTLSSCVPAVTHGQDPLSHRRATVSPVCPRVLCHHLIFMRRGSSGPEYRCSLLMTVVLDSLAISSVTSARPRQQCFTKQF